MKSVSKRVGLIDDEVSLDNAIWCCRCAMSELESARRSAERIELEEAAEEIRAALRHVRLAVQAAGRRRGDGSIG